MSAINFLSGIVPANGINLYYEMYGLDNPQSIVLIGGLSRDHSIWSELLLRLSTQFH